MRLWRCRPAPALPLRLMRPPAARLHQRAGAGGGGFCWLWFSSVGTGPRRLAWPSSKHTVMFVCV